MPNEVTLTFSADGLSALAAMAIAPKNQTLLDDLLSRNREGKLSAEETRGHSGHGHSSLTSGFS